MANKEKAIKGMEHCDFGVSDTCYEKDCPYYQSHDCTDELKNDILALLKEREHSETFIVIDSKTGEEADTYDIALHEDWAKQLCYCDMEGWAIEEDGTLLLVDECGRFEYADRERFKVKWE